MIVLGLGFGDEGKGLTTSYLCSKTKNPIVVRFNGGHQAGHTVVHNETKHVFSSFGSGTLQRVPTYWSKYCTVYPTAFMNEYRVLEEKGFTPEIFIDPLCPITTPYDVELNHKQSQETNHGSVGVGFGTTIQRHENHYKLYFQDVLFPKVFEEKLKNIKNYYHSNSSYTIDKETIDKFIEDVNKMRFRTYIGGHDLFDLYTPIFEGAQGILLDQDFGFFPNVTRSNTTSKNALELYPSKEIYYVTRSYQTRHGNGFMSNEDKPVPLKNNENETNKYNPWQGNFRTSMLDFDLLKYSLTCDNYFSDGLRKYLVITCMDQYELDLDLVQKELSGVLDGLFISGGPSLNNIKQIY